MLFALATAVKQAPAVLYEPMRTEARLQVVIDGDNVTLQATAGPGAARRPSRERAAAISLRLVVDGRVLYAAGGRATRRTRWCAS
jgi:hypothetical protein